MQKSRPMISEVQECDTFVYLVDLSDWGDLLQLGLALMALLAPLRRKTHLSRDQRGTLRICHPGDIKINVRMIHHISQARKYIDHKVSLYKPVNRCI